MKKQVFVYLTDPRHANVEYGYYVTNVSYGGDPPEGWTQVQGEFWVDFEPVTQKQAAEQCIATITKEIQAEEEKIEVMRSEMRKYEALTYES